MINDPNAEDNETTEPDSNTAPVPQSNGRLDVHNLLNLATRDGSVIESRSSDTPDKPDTDKSGIKISTSNCTSCMFVVGATYTAPSTVSGRRGVEMITGETELTKSRQEDARMNIQTMQEMERNFVEMQKESEQLKSQIEELRTELELNRKDIIKRECHKNFLESELAESRKLIIETQNKNQGTKDLANKKELQMLSMLNDNGKQLKDQTRKIEQLQKTIKEREVEIEKQRAAFQENFSQIKELTLKEAERNRKEKETARKNAKQLIRINELEQHIEELNNKLTASKQEADERLNDYKTEKERADRLQSACDKQKQDFVEYKKEILTLAANISNSVPAGTAAPRTQSIATSEHFGQGDGEHNKEIDNVEKQTKKKKIFSSWKKKATSTHLADIGTHQETIAEKSGDAPDAEH